MKFQCSDEQGAFVFMSAPAAKTQMLPSHNLAPFIRHRIDSWHEHVQRQLDLQIARDQLIFVSGVVKTEDWGLGAFMSHAKGGEVAFAAQGPFSFFQGTFSVQSHCAQTGNIQYRAKPLADDRDASPSPSPGTRSLRPSILLDSEGPGSGDEASASASSEQPGGGLAQGLAGTTPSSLVTPPAKRDQTLFIHYYKMKARWWTKRVIKAAAGPDERDPDRSGDGELEDLAAALQVESDEEEIVQEPPIDQVRSLIMMAVECHFAELIELQYIGVRPCGLPAGLHPGISFRGQAKFVVLDSRSHESDDLVFSGRDGGAGGDRE